MKYKLSVSILSILICFNVYQPALTVSAAPVVIEVQQPDGTVIKLRKVGDEWNNRIETLEGYTVEKAIDGWWKYMIPDSQKLKMSDFNVGLDNPEGILPKHLSLPKKPVPETSRASAKKSLSLEGDDSHKVLVILAYFDNQSAVGTTASDWNQKFFTDTNNSVADYFDEVSYGSFSLDPATESHGTANDGVIGWINVGTTHPDTQGSTTDANRQLTYDALVAADPYVDYSMYDSNSDGFISTSELSLVIIVAGYEASFGSLEYTPSVWGHKWSLGWSPVFAPTLDGVKLAKYYGDGDARTGGYIQYGEWHQSSSSNGHMASIGIMCHELGHDIFDLPDLYDTDADNGDSEGIGIFGLMGSGSWGAKNGDSYYGETPVHMCAWSKIYSGLLTPLTPSGTETIPTSASNSTVYKVTTTDPNQYFLVENRQLSGYDRGLYYPVSGFEGGLAIWHINESETDNDDSSSKLVDLEEAENVCEMDCALNRGDKDDLYHSGNSFNVSFTDATTPSSRLQNGTSTGISITGISASGSSMTATFPSASSSYTISASAGTGGTISPSGSVSVDSGNDQTFTISPAGCYTINDVVVDSVSQGAVSSYTFHDVSDDHTIVVSFSPVYYSVTATSSSGGSISPSGVSNPQCGTDLSYTISPEENYQIDSVTVDGSPIGAVSSYTFENIDDNHTIHAVFSEIPTGQYSLTVNVSDGITGTPTEGSHLYDEGTVVNYSYSLSAGYENLSVSLDEGSVSVSGSFSMNSNRVLDATADRISFLIEASAGSGGNISPQGDVSVFYGSDKTFTITPSTGYTVSDVSVDGSSVGSVSSYTFSNITSAHTIHATFETAGTEDNYTISSGCSEGGTISPAGDIVVENGADQAFSITPDNGYRISDVLIDSVSAGDITSYTFKNVNSNHTIYAEFSQNNPPLIHRATAVKPVGTIPFESHFQLTVSDPDGDDITEIRMYIGDNDTPSYVTDSTDFLKIFDSKGIFSLSFEAVDSYGKVSSRSDAVTVIGFELDDSYLPGSYFFTVQESDLLSTNWIVNPENTDSSVTLSFLDADNSILDTGSLTIPPLGKVNLNDELNIESNSIRVESDTRLLLINDITGDNSRMLASIRPPAESSVFLPHIAEETFYWDSYSVISNNEKRSFLFENQFTSETIGADDYMVFHSLNTLMDNPPESQCWGTYHVSSSNPFSTPEPLSGYELFIKKGSDGAGVELPVIGADKIYIPHIPTETDFFWTGFALVNPSDQPATVVFTFFTDSGQLTGGHVLSIPPESKVKGTMESLFPESAGTACWGTIESNVELIATELYGTYDGGICGFSLPFYTLTEWTLPHILNGDNQWTGISLTNPNNSSAHVTILLINSDGIVISETNEFIPPKSRFKTDLKSYYPDVEFDSSFTIKLISDIGILGLEVTGDNDWTFMQAMSGME